jgi:hypothetical protein
MLTPKGRKKVLAKKNRKCKRKTKEKIGRELSSISKVLEKLSPSV